MDDQPGRLVQREEVVVFEEEVERRPRRSSTRARHRLGQRDADHVAERGPRSRPMDAARR